MAERDDGPLVAENPDGAGPFVFVCDHASNRIPERYGSLGLPADALQTHIAWDPGALAVARGLSDLLDAPLLWPNLSRLVIDCNRDPGAPDLIITEGDGRPVPGNRNLDPADRAHRLEAVHAPYHAGDRRLPHRAPGGWKINGIGRHPFLHAGMGWTSRALGRSVSSSTRTAGSPIRSSRQLKSDEIVSIGINEPYSPADRVYYTLARHGSGQGRPAVMIEIRNNEIAEASGQRAWAERLGDIFKSIAPSILKKGMRQHERFLLGAKRKTTQVKRRRFKRVQDVNFETKQTIHSKSGAGPCRGR